MNELALFAGAGGGILGGILNGWRTVCAVEINDYCRRVLMQRQDDGILEPFPIWSDITTFDGKPWAGCVDIVTGGFPCQDISAAGKGAGITGERSGLWKEMARVISEVRPNFVLVENSPMLTLRGLGTVLGDLAAMGFDAEWGCISAAETGAPHKRDRVWIVANSVQDGRNGRMVRNGSKKQRNNRFSEVWSKDWFPTQLRSTNSALRYGGWPIPPEPIGMAARVADGLDRLAAIGNGQVPRVVATAWEVLSDARH